MPRWLKGRGIGLGHRGVRDAARARPTPAATASRAAGKVGGRTHEISRLVGRSLRAVIDTKALGENTIVLDCDVLQADGGTRTAAITGAWVALADAVADARAKGLVAAGAEPLTGSIAAVSVGLVAGRPVLDLDYPEDSTAQTDMNVVMTGDGRFVEVQGTAEGAAPRSTGRCSATCSTSRRPAARELTRLQQDGARRARAGAARVTRRLVLATRNEHKVHELRQILAGLVDELGLEVVGADDVEGAPDVAETEVTFLGNARLKAVALAAGHRAAGGRRRLRAGGRRARRLARGVLRPVVGHDGRAGCRSRASATAPTSTCSSSRSADVPDEHRARGLRLRRRRRAAGRPGRGRRGPGRGPARAGAARHQRLRLRPGLRARTATPAPSPSTPTTRRTRSRTGATPSAPSSRCCATCLAVSPAGPRS